MKSEDDVMHSWKNLWSISAFGRTIDIDIILIENNSRSHDRNDVIVASLWQYVISSCNAWTFATNNIGDTIDSFLMLTYHSSSYGIDIMVSLLWNGIIAVLDN